MIEEEDADEGDSMAEDQMSSDEDEEISDLEEVMDTAEVTTSVHVGPPDICQAAALHFEERVRLADSKKRGGGRPCTRAPKECSAEAASHPLAKLLDGLFYEDSSLGVLLTLRPTDDCLTHHPESNIEATVAALRSNSALRVFMLRLPVGGII
jgi:hypothetical protein